MRIFIKICIIALLLFNIAGALYGGWNLMMHPDGSSLKMPLEFLQSSPFTDYLIPGIILFISNGLFGVLVFVMLLINNKHYLFLVIAQGAILTGWILTQIVMLRTIAGIQLLFMGIGLLIILLGWLMLRINQQHTNEPVERL